MKPRMTTRASPELDAPRQERDRHRCQETRTASRNAPRGAKAERLEARREGEGLDADARPQLSCRQQFAKLDKMIAQGPPQGWPPRACRLVIDANASLMDSAPTYQRRAGGTREQLVKSAHERRPLVRLARSPTTAPSIAVYMRPGAPSAQPSGGCGSPSAHTKTPHALVGGRATASATRVASRRFVRGTAKHRRSRAYPLQRHP